jgi:N-acetylneuraminic acid mutarotase
MLGRAAWFAALAFVLGAAVAIAVVRRPAPIWRTSLAAPMPFARWASGVAVVDGKLYVFGGYAGERLQAITRVDRYDPTANRWQRLADLPEPTTHFTPVVDGATVWFSGGFRGDKGSYVTVDHVWKYDTRTDTWSMGPPLPEPRSAGGAVRLGRALHYFGGYGTDLVTSSGKHWSIALDDSSARWVERAPLPEPRGNLSSVEVHGTAYALGGQVRRDGADVALLHAYDPAHDAWRRLHDLPTPRSHVEPSTFVDGERIVMMGGCDNSAWRVVKGLRGGRLRIVLGRVPDALWTRVWRRVHDRYATQDVLAYDVARDRWSHLSRLPEPLLAPTAVLIDGKVIVTGGSRGGWSDPQTTTYVGTLE